MSESSLSRSIGESYSSAGSPVEVLVSRLWFWKRCARRHGRTKNRRKRGEGRRRAAIRGAEESRGVFCGGALLRESFLLFYSMQNGSAPKTRRSKQLQPTQCILTTTRRKRNSPAYQTPISDPSSSFAPPHTLFRQGSAPSTMAPARPSPLASAPRWRRRRRRPDTQREPIATLARASDPSLYAERTSRGCRSIQAPAEAGWRG